MEVDERGGWRGVGAMAVDVEQVAGAVVAVGDVRQVLHVVARERPREEQDSRPRQAPASPAREDGIDLRAPTGAQCFVHGVVHAGPGTQSASHDDDEPGACQHRHCERDPSAGRGQLTVSDCRGGGRDDDEQEEERQLIGDAAAQPAEHRQRPRATYRLHRHERAPSEEEPADGDTHQHGHAFPVRAELDCAGRPGGWGVVSVRMSSSSPTVCSRPIWSGRGRSAWTR
jgi:hypothetical protein